MKTITQIELAKALKVSPTYINYLVNTVKRPNWKRAKQLSKITGSTPELWLEGTPDEIKAALNNNQPATKAKSET